MCFSALEHPNGRGGTRNRYNSTSALHFHRNHSEMTSSPSESQQHMRNQADPVIKAKLQLRTDNAEAFLSRPALPLKLDSNIKKTTAFLRKLKSISDSTKTSLLKDIHTLNLTRYLSEVASAIAEAKLSKASDIRAAVEIASIVHQRYEGFAEQLGVLLVKELEVSKSLRESEDRKKVASRLRVVLRLYSDLLWVGLSKNEKALVDALKEIMKNDKNHEDLAESAIILSFLKYASDFVKSDPSSGSDCVEVVLKDTRTYLLKMFNAYHAKLLERLEKQYAKMNAKRKSNRKLEFYKGSVGETQQNELVLLSQKFEGLFLTVSTISEFLGLECPEFQEEDDAAMEGMVKVAEMGSFASDSVFEDEESIAFYEKPLNLKAILPPALLGGNSDDKEEQRKTVEATIMKDISGQDKYAFEVFLQNISNMLSVASTDSLSEQFCYFSTKGTQKRLIEVLYSHDRTRIDILPYFARMISTLSQVYPEIGQEMSNLLKGQFYGLARHKSNMLNSRLRNIRYIGELLKFGVCHHSVVFDCWEYCLSDFSSPSIHVFSALLECCGRFLFRTEETHDRCVSFLDRMMKLKRAKYLDRYHQNMIDNALFQCNPPEKQLRVCKQRTLMEEYIRKLVFDDLHEFNVGLIVSKLLKVPFDSVQLYFLAVFTDIDEMKVDRLGSVVKTIVELSKYFPFGVHVVDEVLEQIRVGLEINASKARQNRLLLANYLGELYKAGIVDTNTVMDTLYLFLTFGHSLETADDEDNPLDPSTDFFRVRLVSHLLQSCGSSFSSGTKALKLDRFLVHLQNYLFTKQTIPIDTEFLLDDLFDALRPGMLRFASQEDCEVAVEGLKDDLVKLADLGKFPIKSFVEEESGSEEEEKLVESKEEEEEEEVEDEYDWEARGFSKRIKPRSNEDAEFLDLFDRTVSDSLETRKYEPKVVRNLTDADGLALQASAHQNLKGSKGNVDSMGSKVTFQFVSRKQKGVSAKYFDIPSDVRLAVQNKQAEKEQKKEHEILKQFIVAGLERDTLEESLTHSEYKRADKRTQKPKPQPAKRKSPAEMEFQVKNSVKSTSFED